MRQVWRALSAAVLGAVLAGSCATPAPTVAEATKAQAAPSAGVKAEPWAHEFSDLKADPKVVFGALPNGMRYAIKPNSQPKGVVSLRLRIAAGALQERDDQQGLAHFLEHMAFNGSKNVPEGEMIKILERKGLAFGPDTNAYTSFGETVYMLDLPNNAPDLLDTGLMLMRETADRLTISDAAVARERGVILSEERSRDTPDFRVLRARYGFWLKGQRVPERFPIGLVPVIQETGRDRLADYYAKYYRPERGLLVVTGDIDPAAIEKDIRARFADWAQAAPDAGDPALGAVAKRGLEAAVLVEPRTQTSLTVAWMSPPDLRPDRAALRAEENRRQLAMAVIDRRLQRLARAGDPPFIAAGVGRDDVEKSATIASLSVSTAPGQWEKGLIAAHIELRRAIQFGVSDAELQREIVETRAGLEAAAEGADTRDTRALASEIVRHVHERWVFTHPRDELAAFNASVQGFTADEANRLIRESFSGEGPLLHLASTAPVPGGEAAVKAAFEKAMAAKVEAPALAAAATFPYTDFGKPGAVVARTRDAELGVDMLAFANGVKLNLKKTDFDKDEIGVLVRIGGGQVSLPKGRRGLTWAAPFAFTEGGLGKLDSEALEAATAGKLLGAGLGIGENVFTLAGATRGQDLAQQMQLLGAYITDPGWRGEGLKRLQTNAEGQFKQLNSSPGRVLSRDRSGILRAGDPRFQFPSLAEAQAISVADLRALIAPALAASPIEVTIVGDFDPKAAEAAVAATLGALPKRAAAPAGDAKLSFAAPTAQPIRLAHEGRADQAIGYVAFPAFDMSDMRRARAQRLLSELIQLRLTEEFRERLGASYSPGADSFSSEAFTGFGFLDAVAETKPEEVALFFRIVDEIAAEVRAGQFGDDLIARARQPIVESAITSERTNGYWLSALSDIQSNPKRAAAVKARIGDFRTISRAEILAVAQETLKPERAVRIIVAPKAP